MTKKKPAAKQATTSPCLIVVGYDDHGSPRAAKFSNDEATLVRKAAGFIGYSVHEGDASKLKLLLKTIPPGKIYVSGWDFAPKVRKGVFDRLIAELGVMAPEIPGGPPSPNLAVSWDAIDIGQTVLGQADSAEHGWWPAVVVATEGDMLELRSPDYPKIKVVRHRAAVALLFNSDFQPPVRQPNAAPGLPLDWASLEINHMVLAPDAKAGFYEAIIKKLDGEELTLQWRDSPRLPTFKRLRTNVALVNPIPPKNS